MKAMDLAELQHLLDLHGAGFERWPPMARAAAQTCIASNPAAQTLYQQAQQLHARLAELPEPPLPPLLARSILLTAPAPRGLRGWWRSFTQLWSELGGVRLAGPVLACGLLAGVTWPLLDPHLHAEEAVDLISVAQLGEEQWEINDLETTP